MTVPVNCLRIIHVFNSDLNNHDTIINVLRNLLCKNIFIICRYGEGYQNYCDLVIDDFTSINDSEPIISIPIETIGSLMPRNT